MSATTWKPDPFPKKVLIAAAAVMVFTIACAFLGRLTGHGRVSLPSLPVMESCDVRFEDQPGGAIIVREAAGGRLVVTIAPGTDHFLRVTMRGLVRERSSAGVGAKPPFRVSRVAGMGLMLEDPATHRRIDLEAFGHSNALAFGAILDAAARLPRGGAS